ncbi:MAG: hypothetical protein KC417_00410 [Myxococcales bacterium]|nr:hypothetical protein [Myxococcales bacterium]
MVRLPTEPFLALRAVLCAVGLALCGCHGAVEGSAGPQGAAGDADRNGAASSAPFALSDEAAKLLPFDVRLAKVAAVVGVPTSDPVFDAMRERRLALGDYDHAVGVLPDSQWSASRMAEWVRVLRPICQSDAFKLKSPNLPAGLDTLIAAAYGRDATSQDREDVELGLGGPTGTTALTAEQEHELTCLSVLSSAEMVLQ